VAATSGPSRATSLQTISLVNATRIEVYKVPTPDMPASSLGGSINLVSKTPKLENSFYHADLGIGTAEKVAELSWL